MNKKDYGHVSKMLAYLRALLLLFIINNTIPWIGGQRQQIPARLVIGSIGALGPASH